MGADEGEGAVLTVEVDSAMELFGIGSSLREARLRRGLELADIERATCIRAANIAAIEDERFDTLAADVYTAGFIRSYAEHLGLDGDRFVARFRQSRESVSEPIVHDTLGLAERRRRGRLLAIVVVLACAGGAAAFLLRSHVPSSSAPGAAPRAAKPAPSKKPSGPAPAFRGPLVIRASGGDTWVSVRFGDAHGRVVWQGVLKQPLQLRFGLTRPLWVGFGHPDAVTVRAGGSRVGLPPARSQFIFSSSGVRRG